MTDQKFERSIFDHGLRRYKRDSLHFMYDNDGLNGYIRKGAGTRPPRHYDTTRYCISKKFKLIRDGFDLFLTSNGVISIYDDLPLDYFLLLTSFLMLVSMPSARQVDMVYLLKFRLAPGDLTCLFDKSTRNTCHQARYLSTWKNDQLVEFKIPRNPPPQRRQTAWEFMGQEVPENYLNLFNNLFQERSELRYLQAQHQLR